MKTYIGIKDNHIRLFNTSREALVLNAKMSNLVLDKIEETDEDVVMGHHTPYDGIYYLASQVPDIPLEVQNQQADHLRQEQYALLSDPKMCKIMFLREKLYHDDYETKQEKREILKKIELLYTEVAEARSRIRQQHPKATS